MNVRPILLCCGSQANTRLIHLSSGNKCLCDHILKPLHSNCCSMRMCHSCRMSCHGPFQLISGGGPTMRRSNFPQCQSVSQACTPRGALNFHFVHTLHAHWLQKSKKPFNCCFHTSKSCAVSSQRPNRW